MTRTVQLSNLKQGIQRIRDKGGASPDALYDLLNGYVTIDGSIKSRPGTELHAALPAGTVGLMPWGGRLVVFATSAKTGLPSGVDCEVIAHPTDAAQALKYIWFARPMMGYPYVVAEFANGDVFHYWLQGSFTTESAWKANHVYGLDEVVVPGNGLAYRAKRLNAADPVWKAGEAHAIGDKREPTTFNKYTYTVSAVGGDSPRSGTVEPDWPAKDGDVVTEWADATPAAPDTSTGGGTTSPGGDIEDRYCVAADSLLDDDTLASEAKVGDLHLTWTPEEGWRRNRIVAVGKPIMQPCVRIVLDDGSSLRCSTTTPFTDPDALRDGDGWLAKDMLGKRAFNAAGIPCDVIAVDDIGDQLVVPIDIGGRSFGAGDLGLVYSHNIRKGPDNFTRGELA